MTEEELIPNNAYRLTKHVDGNKAGSLVIFKWMCDKKAKNGKPLAICSPNGEPDMQSMFSCYLDELEQAN